MTERPHFGAATVPVAGDLAHALNLPAQGGLHIQQVQQGTSADAAGLRGAQQLVIVGNEQLGIGGDLIMEVDGQPVDREDAIVRILARKRVGDTVNVAIFRNGRSLNVRMKLLRAPFDQGQ